MSLRIPVSLVIVLSCACGDSDGRGDTAVATAATAATSVTAASIGSVSETGAGPTEATGVATSGGPAASEGGETGGEVSTYDSDSFPQTSVVSWEGSGFDETATPPPDCENILYATVRDFQASHPDFEYI